MQARQNRRGTVGLADLDGIMLLGAVTRAKDMQPRLLRSAQRHLRRHDGAQLSPKVERPLQICAMQQGDRVLFCKFRRIRKFHAHNGR